MDASISASCSSTSAAPSISISIPLVFDGYRVSILTRIPNSAATVKLIKKYGGNVIINPHVHDANGTTAIALADPSLLHRIPPLLLSAFGSRLYSCASISECVRQQSIARLEHYRITSNDTSTNTNMDAGNTGNIAAADHSRTTPTHVSSAPRTSMEPTPSTKFTSPLAVTSSSQQQSTRKRKDDEDGGGSVSPTEPNNTAQESQDSSSRSKDIENCVSFLEASGFSRVLIVHALLITSGDMKLARAYLANQLPQDVHLWGPQEDLALNGHDTSLTKQLVQRIGKLETAKRVKFLHSA